MFKVIVAGGRDFNNYKGLSDSLDYLLKNINDDIQIVCGMARGADRLGERYAKEHGYQVIYFPADWDLDGKSAGFKRNVKMAEYADALVAFWDGESKGTKHMIETAKEKAEQAEDNSGNTEDDTQGDLSETEDEILSNLQLLLIGDSVALGTVDEFYSVFPNSICDAAISRYTTESYDIYDAYVNDQGWNGDGVIFALGTNGLMYDSLPTLRERMGSDLPLFIITVRAPYATWEDSNNQEMHEFVKANPNTYLIDWYTASEGHSEYFDGDETHVNSTGAQAFIDCIKNAVLPVYE